MGVHNFGWKAFWDSKPDWSCLRLDSRHSVEAAMIGKSASRTPFACYTLAFALQMRNKSAENPRVIVVKNSQLGTIQYVDSAAF
jgi:hypothetical protein